MTTEIALFFLRLASGVMLLLMLSALFYILWKDYRSAAQKAEAGRRAYGRVVVLHEMDGVYAVSDEAYPLLPITSLGRSPTNSIRIEDTFASSEHALIAMRDGQWWLEDRQSRNGTTLNGVMVKQPVIVTNGDVIGVGNVRFRLEMEK